jgi:hypothetical protein
MNAQDKEAIAKEVDSFINEDLAHLELLLQAKELEIEVAAEGTKHLQHCQEQLQDQLQVGCPLRAHWKLQAHGTLNEAFMPFSTKHC